MLFYLSDSTIGGTNDVTNIKGQISKSDGKTTITFSRPLGNLLAVSGALSCLFVKKQSNS